MAIAKRVSAKGCFGSIICARSHYPWIDRGCARCDYQLGFIHVLFLSRSAFLFTWNHLVTVVTLREVRTPTDPFTRPRTLIGIPTNRRSKTKREFHSPRGFFIHNNEKARERNKNNLRKTLYNESEIKVEFFYLRWFTCRRQANIGVKRNEELRNSLIK